MKRKFPIRSPVTLPSMRHKELGPPGEESDGGKTLRDDCDEINRRIIIYIQCEVHVNITVNITMHSHDRVITSAIIIIY